MTRWLVKLAGNESDLDALVKLNTEPDFRVTNKDEAYYLTCVEFDQMQEAAEVYAATKDALLPDINGLMQLRNADSQSVSVDCVVQQNADGSQTTARYLFGTARIVASAGLTAEAVVIGPDGTVVPSPEPANFQARRKLARKHAEVRQALAYWFACDATAPDFWVNAYKVFEVIRGDIAGGRGKGQGTEEMKRRGWAMQDEIRSFKESANNHAISGDKARHASTQPLEPGIAPLHEGEALALIKRMLECWLDWKIARSGNDTP